MAHVRDWPRSLTLARPTNKSINNQIPKQIAYNIVLCIFTMFTQKYYYTRLYNPNPCLFNPYTKFTSLLSLTRSSSFYQDIPMASVTKHIQRVLETMNQQEALLIWSSYDSNDSWHLYQLNTVGVSCQLLKESQNSVSFLFLLLPCKQLRLNQQT